MVQRDRLKNMRGKIKIQKYIFVYIYIYLYIYEVCIHKEEKKFQNRQSVFFQVSPYLRCLKETLILIVILVKN